MGGGARGPVGSGFEGLRRGFWGIVDVLLSRGETLNEGDEGETLHFTGPDLLMC